MPMPANIGSNAVYSNSFFVFILIIFRLVLLCYEALAEDFP